MRGLASLIGTLSVPIDAAGLVAFRIAFGLLMFVSTLRTAIRGWISALYIEPALHFHYWGFGWIEPLPPAGMFAVFALLALLSLAIAAGRGYRCSLAAFFLLFTYVELIDKATYLNHHYLIALLALLMFALPLGRPREGGLGPAFVPRWALWTLRLQIGLVYVFAGLAKLRPDWLFHAQPLRTWLAARADFPVLGPLFRLPQVAYAMSWAGALFDLTLPFLLLHPRTRPWAYLAALGFHGLTGALFPIGMFPWLMACAALVFFPPEWPRVLYSRLSKRTCSQRPVPNTPAKHPPRLVLGALALHFAVQLVLPLRRLAHPGDTAWTEEGFRFAWQVMLVEKVGMVTYRVRDPATGRERRIDPEPRLTRLQLQQMSFQPDMILEFAHYLAAEFPGHEVYADAFVAYNGRPNARLIDPAVDLARVREGLRSAPWIVPLEHVSADERAHQGSNLGPSA